MSRPRIPYTLQAAACLLACLGSSCCQTIQTEHHSTGGTGMTTAAPGAFDVWRRTLPAGQQALFIPETTVAMAEGWLPVSAWQTVEPVAFGFLDGTRDTPQAPTLARVVTKQGLLFLRFECREPDMGRLVYAHAGRDSAALWRDDVVEILLQPGDAAPLYHLMVNPIGASFDAVSVAGKGEDSSWDPPLRSRTFIEKDGWTVEVSLPLSACLASKDATNSNATAVWRASLIRARQGRAGAFAEDTGWCSTGSPGAGSGQRLGYFYLDALSNGRPLPAAPVVNGTDRKQDSGDSTKVAATLRGIYNRPALVVDAGTHASSAIQLVPLSATFVGTCEPTEVRVQREPDGLRLQVRCTESAPQSIQAKPDTREENLWKDDCVEVFLSPGRKESADYLHLVVNAAGALSTERGAKRAAMAGIRAVASIGTNAWTVDLRVPFSSFALPAAQIPALWGLNVTRTRPARPDAAEQSTAWSRFSWSAHDPASFGSLWLADADLFPELGGSVAAGADARPERAVKAASWIADPDVFGPAEKKTLALPSMVDRHMALLRDQLLAKRDQEWGQAKTKEDALRIKATIRAGFLQAIGGLPEVKTPLKPRVSVVFENDELRIERLIYESRPKFYVTANVFVPKKPGARRLPVVLRIVGHNTSGRHSALAYCEELARSGYFVMTLDALGQGERIYTSNGLGSRTPTSNHYGEGAGFFLTDANLAGYMIYDVMRAIDYIETRTEADAHRIVLTGESGGGTLTEYVTALDDRLFAAAPVSSGGSDRNGGGSYDSEQVLFGSFPFALDIEGFGALAAPRPYCVITEAGDEGRKATERSFEIARGIAAMADGPEAGARLKYVPTSAPHGYGKTHYQHFRKWLAQVMPPDPDGPRVTGPVAYDHGAARASSSGRVFFSRDLPDGETTFTLNAKRITLASAIDATVTTREAAAGRSACIRDALVGRLALNGERFMARSVELRGTSAVSDCSVEKLVLETDPGVLVPALLLSPKASPALRTPRAAAVVWVSSRGKHGVLDMRADELKAMLAAGTKVLIPDLRGLGETAGDPDTTFMGDEASRNGMGIRLGIPLIGMRVKDVLCCVNYLRTRADVDPAQIGLLGDSPSTPNPAHIRQPVLITDATLEPLTQAESLGPVVALLAFVLDTNVARCATCGLPSSYAAMCTTPYFYHPFGVFVPGILKTCDLADLCAVAAPRPLLLAGSVNELNQRLDQANPSDSAFERAVRGYRLQQAEQALRIQPAPDLQSSAAFFAVRR